MEDIQQIIHSENPSKKFKSEKHYKSSMKDDIQNDPLFEVSPNEETNNLESKSVIEKSYDCFEKNLESYQTQQIQGYKPDSDSFGKIVVREPMSDVKEKRNVHKFDSDKYIKEKVGENKYYYRIKQNYKEPIFNKDENSHMSIYKKQPDQMTFYSNHYTQASPPIEINFEEQNQNNNKQKFNDEIDKNIINNYLQENVLKHPQNESMMQTNKNSIYKNQSQNDIHFVCNNKINELLSELDNKNNEIDKLKNEIEKKDVSISSIHVEFKQLKNSIDNFQNENSSLKYNNENLNIQNNELKNINKVF